MILFLGVRFTDCESFAGGTRLAMSASYTTQEVATSIESATESDQSKLYGKFGSLEMKSVQNPSDPLLHDEDASFKCLTSCASFATSIIDGHNVIVDGESDQMLWRISQVARSINALSLAAQPLESGEQNVKPLPLFRQDSADVIDNIADASGGTEDEALLRARSLLRKMEMTDDDKVGEPAPGGDEATGREMERTGAVFSLEEISSEENDVAVLGRIREIARGILGVGTAQQEMSAAGDAASLVMGAEIGGNAVEECGDKSARNFNPAAETTGCGKAVQGASGSSVCGWENKEHSVVDGSVEWGSHVEREDSEELESYRGVAQVDADVSESGDHARSEAGMESLAEKGSIPEAEQTRGGDVPYQEVGEHCERSLARGFKVRVNELRLRGLTANLLSDHGRQKNAAVGNDVRVEFLVKLELEGSKGRSGMATATRGEVSWKNACDMWASHTGALLCAKVVQQRTRGGGLCAVEARVGTVEIPLDWGGERGISERVKEYAWHPVMGNRQAECQLELGVGLDYEEDESEIEEGTRVQDTPIDDLEEDKSAETKIADGNDAVQIGASFPFGLETASKGATVGAWATVRQASELLQRAWRGHVARGLALSWAARRRLAGFRAVGSQNGPARSGLEQRNRDGVTLSCSVGEALLRRPARKGNPTETTGGHDERSVVNRRECMDQWMTAADCREASHPSTKVDNRKARLPKFDKISLIGGEVEARAGEGGSAWAWSGARTRDAAWGENGAGEGWSQGCGLAAGQALREEWGVGGLANRGLRQLDTLRARNGKSPHSSGSAALENAASSVQSMRRCKIESHDAGGGLDDMRWGAGLRGKDIGHGEFSGGCAVGGEELFNFRGHHWGKVHSCAARLLES